MVSKIKTKRQKLLITCISGAFLFCLYLLIFSFSEQDGERSGSLSYFISEKCVEFINALSGNNWTEVIIQGMAEYLEHPIRKLAHFSEYAVMGILVYICCSQWMARGRCLYLLTVVWVFVSAGADEFHQLFVPGRYGSFLDVLLDTSGGIFGILLCVLFSVLWSRHIRKKEGFNQKKWKHKTGTRKRNRR